MKLLICHPWDIKKNWQGTSFMLEFQMSNFEEWKFDFEEFGKEPKNKKLVMVVDYVVRRLVELQEEGRYPWILLMGRDGVFLQSIAKATALTYALSVPINEDRKVSESGAGRPQVLSITTDQFMEWADQREIGSEHEIITDPSQKAYMFTMSADLLVWEDITVKPRRRWEGQLSRVLVDRLKTRRATLFTAQTEKVRGKLPEMRVYDQLQGVLGYPIMSYVRETAVPIWLKQSESERPPRVDLEV